MFFPRIPKGGIVGVWTTSPFSGGPHHGRVNNVASERTLSGSDIVGATPERAYRALVDPDEQVQWNTLYRSAAVEPSGEISTGSEMHVDIKGSGRSRVYFDDVRPGA